MKRTNEIDWNPEIESPGKRPHPQFILEYLSAFRVANPEREPPLVWDRGNGWVNVEDRVTSSYRRSQIIQMTKNLLERTA